MAKAERASAAIRLVTAITTAAIGAVLLIEGITLVRLSGTLYYAASALLWLATAALILKRRRAAALTVFALLIAATLVWALGEVGLDWWQLAPRGGVIVVAGSVLLLPPVASAIGPGSRRGDLWLAVTLVAAGLVAGVALTRTPHTLSGALPAYRGAAVVAPAADWTAYAGDTSGLRWSALADITPANVASLVPLWHYRTGDLQRPGDPYSVTYEVTPLKIGRALYLCTPHGLAIAIDAETGREIWRFDPKISVTARAPFLTCRGLSYLPPSDAAAAAPCAARLFLPTADARLIALDPATGRPCGDFGRAGAVDLWRGMPGITAGIYYATSPPVIANGLVVIGGQVNDNQSIEEPSGVIRAYDGRTGRLVWNWDAGRPTRTAPIGPGERYTANSPNSWSLSSFDPALGLIYVPIGNQTPDAFGGHRPATTDRLASSVVALEAATGRLRWVFQTVHHDLWDMDVGSQPVIVDLDRPGGRVPALVVATKTGNIFILDRRSGWPLLPVEERRVPGGAVPGDRTASTQPFSPLNLLAGSPVRERDMWGATLFGQLQCRIAFRGLRYEGPFTPPSVQGTLVHPGHLGVFNWSGISVDPVRQVAIATPNAMAYVDRLIPRGRTDSAAASGTETGLNPNRGAPYAVDIQPFLGVSGLPCQAPPWGTIAGIDLRSGTVVWRRPNGTVRDLAPVPLPFAMGVPSLGGPLSTAGGVAFLSGSLDNYVRGYDVTTGRELWRARLPAGGQATPMTYRAPDSGRQILLVVAGGYKALGTTPGDHVIAYALPR